MADIAIGGTIAVLRQVAVMLGNQVVKEGSRFLRLTKDLEWIESEMRYIRCYLEDVEEKQWGSTLVTNLVRDIWDIAYDVEDIMNTYFPKLSSSRGRNNRKRRLGFLKNGQFIRSNYKTARDFAVEVEEIKKRVGDIDRLRRTYGIQEKSGCNEGDRWDPRGASHNIDEVNVVGLDEDIKKLVDKVLNEGLQHPVTVSIVGMAGLGKTTLAKKVYNSVRQSFDCSAWICVSLQPNIAELLLDIARQVGLSTWRRENSVKDSLCEFLEGKRYIIVVDDIWKTASWDALKVAIPTNSKVGSRIILTSRNTDVAIHVGGQSCIHQLQPLDGEDSANLFFRTIIGPPENIKETSEAPPQLENIGEQILKRCGGVPLAIVVTAGMLLQRERTAHAWKGVLENMGQEEEQCSKIFALSYKDLPTKLKPCFLYFGLFPEDYEIPAFDIINLWVAEGFIRGNDGQEVEQVGEDYLNQLIARNLVQVVRRGKFTGRIKRCRIHDILHSLCVRMAKEINFFDTYNDVATSNVSMKVRRVSTYGSSLREFISLDYRTPKLRAMLCFNREDLIELKRKHVQIFLGDGRFLRVLSLECSSLKISLPSEIGNLTHLSYFRLKVADGHIKLPSTIGNLTSLLTLDARGCCPLIIPNCVWKMKQLRHILLSQNSKIELDLGGLLSNVGKFLHPIEASAENLQTLYGFTVPHWAAKYWFPKFMSLRKLGVYFEDHSELSNVKLLLDAITESHKLEILRLKSSQFHNIVDLNLSRYENLVRLHLEVKMVELPEHDKLPPNLAKLTLVWTQLEKDPMETLKKLPQLKILKLGRGSYMGKEMMVCSGGGPDGDFPQLQELEIVELYSLKELVVEEDVLPRLKKFRITGCRDLAPKVPQRITHILITN